MKGFPLSVSYYVGTSGTHTEIRRVAEEKVTLPCHHQLGLPEKDTLDIEWLLTDNEGNQKVVSICPLEPLPSPPSFAFPQLQSFSLGQKGLESLFSSADKDSRHKTIHKKGYLGCWDKSFCVLWGNKSYWNPPKEGLRTAKVFSKGTHCSHSML